jgi:hypothetical protein
MFTFGEFVLVGLAYALPNWRHLTIAGVQKKAPWQRTQLLLTARNVLASNDDMSYSSF